MAGPKVTLDADAKRLVREFTKASKSADLLTRELKKATTAGTAMGTETEKAARKQSVSMEKGIRTAKNLVGALGLGGGVAGAVGLIRQGYQAWLAEIKNVNQASNKLQDDIASFAAMMPAGSKRRETLAAGKFIASHGIAQGPGMDIMQSMRSQHGETTGRAMSKAIFQAQILGVPAELAQELEVTGSSSGMAPGSALRHAIIAGQASARDPKMLAKAAEGLPDWADKRLGFAAAAPLAALYGDKVGTYLSQGGRALTMQASEEAQATYIKMGLGRGHTQRERLAGLHEMGVRSRQDVADIGITELRQNKAVSTMLEKYAEIQKVEKALEQRANVGLIPEAIQAHFAEFPEARNKFAQASLSSRQALEKGLGPNAQDAGKEMTRQQARAMAMRRLGYAVSGPFATTKPGPGDSEISDVGDMWQRGIMDVVGQFLYTTDDVVDALAQTPAALLGVKRRFPKPGPKGLSSTAEDQPWWGSFGLEGLAAVQAETNAILREQNELLRKQGGPSTLAKPNQDR